MSYKKCLIKCHMPYKNFPIKMSYIVPHRMPYRNALLKLPNKNAF